MAMNMEQRLFDQLASLNKHKNSINTDGAPQQKPMITDLDNNNYINNTEIVSQIYNKIEHDNFRGDYSVPNNYMQKEVTNNPNSMVNRTFRNFSNIYPKALDSKFPVLQRMNWKKYHRLSVIHEFMDTLEKDYPSICTTGVIGESLEGRPLKVLKVSNSNASNAAVWLDAGIHAREWITPATASYIADYIVKNFKTLPEYMTNKDWYILPVLNPDGYEYSHTTDRMWRKNRAWHNNDCVGVDLNRNFSIGWGGKGSSEKPTSNFYKGPEPFSEPESTAVRDLLLNAGVSFSVYMTLHCYGQVILFPYAFQDEVCPDYLRLLRGATIMSKAIYNTSGNIYKVGISRDVMHGAAGTSTDWSYGGANIPFCYLMELQSKKHKFLLPAEEIEPTAIEILSGVRALMEFVDSYTEKENKKTSTFNKFGKFSYKT